MKWAIKEHPGFGKSLYADNGVIEIIIPLEYGLRIGHFSLCGGENVFFEQPADMTDLATEAGWRVRGGHRLWVAPESPGVYYPDNDPISYEVSDDKITIWQKEDPWLHVKKSMTISFEEGARLKVLHKVENTADVPLSGALWPVTSVDAGGIEYISLALRDGGYDHWHRISMWDYTSLGDSKAEYTREQIKLTHMPVSQKYKIGVGHPLGPVRYENKGVTFVKSFPVYADQKYPDGDVSYETFLCKHMVEMESLSPLRTLAPGESMEHQEVWELKANK